MKGTLFPFIAIFALGIGITSAQQPGRALGVVEAIDTGGQITLKTDQGPALKVVPQSGARFVRVPPGETSLAKATPITAADIGPGDRLLARGQMSDDKTSLSATLIVVMTKADIAKKHEADREEWQRRGIGGIVSDVNPAAGEVTITSRSLEGAKPLVIVTGPNTVIRRYPPDSVKFADAKPSTIAEIRKGDQVRALGARSADGSRYTAEELVSGSFRNIAATISSVDPATNTLKVTDLATKKPLLVHVNSDSTIRRLPEMVARLIALRTSASPGNGPSGAPGAGGPPHPPQGAPANAPGGSGGPAGMGNGRPRDLQQMLERMPPLKLEDLKPGDAIIIASTQGADPGQVTAITLLAGVEPILSAAPSGSQRAMMLGSWNLDMNMGGMQ
jgi:antitoxin (DNA-binding transcriptional repressor) of toxin-antitoxin stability system